MKPNFFYGVIPLVLTLAMPASAEDSNWPNYLGPDKNAVSPDPTPLADSWPAEGPPELWSHKLSPGHGGAAIYDGKVYLMDRFAGRKDLLQVLDLKTGELIKEAEVESAGRVNFPGSRGVPSVTEEHVFASGPMGLVTAWKRDDLSQLWSIDVVKELGSEPLFFGYSVQPQVYGDLVIISANAEDANVVALDKDTGKVVWKRGGLFGSLASPIIQKFQGRDQIFYISQELPEKPGKGGEPSVAGLDPETGEVLWRYQGYAQNLPITPPAVVDDQTLFLTGGYKGGSQLVKFDGENKPVGKMVSKWGAHLCPPVVHDGHVYFLTHENGTVKKKNTWSEHGLNCMTADGEILWISGEEPMFGRGSMIFADGKLIIRDSYYGKLYLVKPDPAGFKQLASANPFGHDRRNLERWGPLAISNGLLLIRDEREIKCLDLRKK